MVVKVDAKFKIEVIFNGIERVLEINAHQAMQAVLEHAIQTFEITSNQHLLALFTVDNREYTDLNESAGDAGLRAGVVVVLRQSQVRGG